MTRPASPVLLTRHIDDETYVEVMACADASVYSVCLDGEPISLRTVQSWVLPKYTKCSNANPAWPIRLAARLNAEFNTNRFGVLKFSAGTPIPLDMATPLRPRSHNYQRKVPT